jgi:exodeoxyribonuclease III
MKSRSRQFDESAVSAEELKKEERYRGVTGNGKTGSRLRLVMWNVNGIRSVLNKNAMRDLIDKYCPDFICINETKINAEIYAKEKIKLAGYNDYWNFCKCSAGYSGVAVFSRFRPLSIFEDLEEAAYSQEGRVLTLEYEQFYLVVVYMPSAGDKELKRLDYKVQKYEVAFQRYCKGLKERALLAGKGLILCGDFNVSYEDIDIHLTPYTHKQPGFTPAERSSFKRLLGLGLADTFRRLHPQQREYTWWRIEHNNRQRNIGKRLDYFLVN